MVDFLSSSSSSLHILRGVIASLQKVDLTLHHYHHHHIQRQQQLTPLGAGVGGVLEYYERIDIAIVARRTVDGGRVCDCGVKMGDFLALAQCVRVKGLPHRGLGYGYRIGRR